MDNYFTNFEMANFLLQKQLILVGTMRPNRREIPPIMKHNAQRTIYESVFGFCNQATMVSYKAKKEKSVVLLSTMHHDNFVMNFLCYYDGEKQHDMLIKANYGGNDPMWNTLSGTSRAKRKKEKALLYLSSKEGKKIGVFLFYLRTKCVNADGKPVFLRDIWPTRDEIQAVERKCVIPGMFKEVYEKIEKVNESWNNLKAPTEKLYPWDQKSTYIKSPPFFDELTMELVPSQPITDAYVLLNLGDSVTTDHISPAGNIARNSPAARYLTNRGLTPREFNSYGSRRGNDAVMARGTFANIRLFNKFINKQAPLTIHFPSNETVDIFDAAERYMQAGQNLIILTGKEYGSGSSRDWAAKGPFLQGIKAVLAESYERIHRSNLVGMGIVPLQYLPGENAEALGLTGKERYTILIPKAKDLRPGMTVERSR
ncbi:unnamed protein product [Ranitomeya imitator]|uniref:Aconitate hydratase n=1 Tax=Ranitomeya imitator TaxID=111125 RepID=A0ABN9L858_9NEOB|nr:unnamed protein product [Ranitomeya imitator]